MRRTLAGVACLTALASAAACGRAPAENVAPPPAPVVAPPRAPVTLVGHERLAALVPDLQGWTREPTTSATVNLPAPAAHASATYARGKARIDLEITDTGGHPDYVGSLATVAGTSFIQKAANGYMKGTTIAGFPATESWNHTDKLGDISILVDGRFVVHATGTGLDRIETLRALIEKVDLTKIKSP